MRVMIKMDPKSRSEVLERIKSQILKVKGTLGAAELNREQRETVARLEEEAMGNVLGGMGKGRNEGVKESLSREIVMVFFVDMSFDTPKDANMMVLMSKGEVVGWDSMDPEAIKKFKADNKYMVLSDFFVMRRDVKLSQDAFASGDMYFLFNGIKIEQFSNIPEVKDHMVSIPSPPAFSYLHELFKDKMDLSEPKIGGFLIGFNLS
jgi:hypothetical protein